MKCIQSQTKQRKASEVPAKSLKCIIALGPRLTSHSFNNAQICVCVFRRRGIVYLPATRWGSWRPAKSEVSALEHWSVWWRRYWQRLETTTSPTPPSSCPPTEPLPARRLYYSYCWTGRARFSVLHKPPERMQRPHVWVISLYFILQLRKCGRKWARHRKMPKLWKHRSHQKVRYLLKCSSVSVPYW